jgi:hypothetical protein
MFDAGDVVSPVAHFKPQRHYNATCGLVFSDPQDNEGRRVAMEAYYDKRGGRDFWPYEFNDPRMCIGFYQLGQLQNFDTQSADARKSLQQGLATDHVVSWVTST